MTMVARRVRWASPDSTTVFPPTLCDWVVKAAGEVKAAAEASREATQSNFILVREFLTERSDSVWGKDVLGQETRELFCASMVGEREIS